MKTEAFANSEVYPRFVPESRLQSRLHHEDFKQMTDWSQFLGDSLHCFMRGEQPSLNERVLSDYVRYMNEIAPKIREEVVPTYPTYRARAYANTELSMYMQNVAMARMWLPVIHGQWRSRDEHDNAVQQSRYNVARLATVTYIEREDFTNKLGGAHRLANVSTGRKFMLGGMNGSLVEADTAVAVLSAMSSAAPGSKVSDSFFLTAPYQFEHSGNGAPNVDFIVGYLSRREVVGLQCKSWVRESDFMMADSNRVLLVDGRTELGGYRIVPSLHQWGVMNEISWAGGLSVAAYRADYNSEADPVLPSNAEVYPSSFYSQKQDLLWGRIVNKMEETRDAPA